MEKFSRSQALNRRWRQPALLAGLGLALVPTAGLAQNPQAIQQADAVQQQRQLAAAGQAFNTNTVPELYPG